MTDIATSPAHVQAAAISKGEISSRELLDVFLDRVERLGAPVNAVVTIDAEPAREAARAADDARARGTSLGPLHGLPMTIKDAIEVGGMRSTGGAVELTDHVPVADAPAVARLRAAGAVIFGKTNAPRWSGDFQTHNAIFGTTSNPWALDRTVGGSSGGAAAAMACGFSGLELGTDIGGSVRIPSHCCGVFALKPSYGVVPQRGYLDHVGGGLTDADVNVFGPIARSAEDLDLALSVLAGPEPERAVAWKLDLPGPRANELSGYRIGVWFEVPSCPVDRAVSTLLRGTVDAMERAGAKVEEAHPQVDFDEQVALFMRLVGAAVSPSAPDDQAEARSGTHLAWLRADEERARLRRVWAEWFTSYDLLLCPVMQVAAPPHDHSEPMLERTIELNGERVPYLGAVQWAGFIGVVGLPSAVPPIGRTPAGLPVGMQVVAPHLRDRDAVRGASLIAAVTGGYQVPPGF
jgi:amidase